MNYEHYIYSGNITKDIYSNKITEQRVFTCANEKASYKFIYQSTNGSKLKVEFSNVSFEFLKLCTTIDEFGIEYLTKILRLADWYRVGTYDIVYIDNFKFLVTANTQRSFKLTQLHYTTSYEYPEDEDKNYDNNIIE